MLIQRPVLEMLFQEIEDRHKKPFWKIFCNLVNFNDLNNSGASEYELYFNYAISKSQQFSTRTLKWADIRVLETFDIFKQMDFDVIYLHSYNLIN